MKPILYPKNATAEQISSNKNGIGKLSDTISCVVIEELNGQYDLQITYPITGAHFADIGINSVIVCLHEDSDDLQPFEVYDIKKGISGKAEIYAHHISYRLNNTVAMPFSVSVGANACANTLAGLKSNATETIPFTFWTDVHTLGTYNQPVPAPIRARLGGVEGSVLDQFGGEYEWDKFAVKLHLERGNPITGIVLKYGKNITDIEQEEELSNVITGVVPFWTKQDGDDTLYADLPEKVIYSQYAGNYPYHLTKPLDLSDQWENQPSEATLRSAAQAYVNSAKLGIPKVSITVSFVALWQTEEYKEIAPLERVKMGDTVTVYFESLGIEAFARVVATKYNVLLEKYDEVQIGSARSTLAQVLNDQRAETINSIENTKQYANEAANNATKWLTATGGYVTAVKNQDGHWEKLVIANVSDPTRSDAKGILLSQNGLGFFLNGMNSTFYQGWTCDGKLLIGTPTAGGIITKYAPAIEIYKAGSLVGQWNENGILIKSGVFQLGNKTSLTDANSGVYISSGGIALGANSTFLVTNAGVLTMKSGTIQLGDKTSLTDANNGLYLSSGGIALGPNSKFKVLNTGVLTATDATITGAIKATSGEIGSGNSKFTITGNHIANGKSSLTDANNGVYVGTDGIALGANSKFKVTNDGALNATNATLTGTINNVNGNNTVSMANGQMVLNNNTAHNAIHMTNASNELVSMGADDVYYTDHDELFLQTSWSDLVDVGAHRDKLKAMYNQYMGGGW